MYVYIYIYLFYYFFIHVYTHTSTHIYTHARYLTNTQHLKPFNLLLTRFLLTKHVEEFFPLSHQARSAMRQRSRLAWELTRPSLTRMSQQTSSADRGDTTHTLNKAEWGRDWCLGDVASSSSLLVPVACKSSLMSQVP